ncbi:unnamed protein product, partial [Chrysoparadoxa australica]
DEKDHFFEGVYDVGEDESDEANGVVAMSDYAQILDTPNKVVLTNVFANSAWQPGGRKDASGKVFNVSEDAVEVVPRVAQVQHIAMNFLFTQEDLILLKKSYLSAVRRKAIKADEIPFGMYLLNEIKMRAKEELRLAYYESIHDAQGTNYSALFDGWRQQILAAIVSGDIPAGNIIDTAVLAANNAVGEIEKIVAGIPTKYLNKVDCLVSRATKKMYEDDFRSRYNQSPWNTGFKKPGIEGTGINFLVEPGLDGFTRPLFVVKNNFVRLHDSSDKADLDIDYDKRERDIAVTVDGQAGCGFANGNHIWTNDGV